MNSRQENFCFYYASSGNGYEAAKKAGYSEKSAKHQASRLLTNDNLKQKISEIRKQSLEELKIETRDIISGLSQIAFSSLSDVVEIDNKGHLSIKADANLDALSNISFSKSKRSNSFSIKTSDRLSALKELAKLTGAYDAISQEDDSDEIIYNILEAAKRLSSK